MKLVGLPFPDEDSKDITDEEVAEAIPIQAPSDIGELIHLSCGSCGATPMAISKHERRRRKPLEFSRVTLRCPQGHEVRKLLIRAWAT